MTEKKIIEKIRKLKEHGAPGPDGISAYLLRTADTELARPLKKIFEQSLSSGVVPSDWRHATVVPIFKKGTKGSAGNYRPVSLTSIPGKIMESLLKEDIKKHLEEHTLIGLSQHGFMKNKSCTTNLVLFMNKLTSIVDEGGAADVFYLDFAKAFDKVPTQRLLLKLKNKGVDGFVYEWVKEWLKDRTQAVRVGQEHSDKSVVGSGVPQGSVLGPILFSIFIDDLDKYATEIDLVLKFADDTKGLQEVKGTEDRDKLQRTLDRLSEWAADWGLAFNVAKCKIMHIGKNNSCYEYTMSGVRLEVVEEERDIGVIVHKSLKPTKQCKKAADMASAVLRQLCKNFHYRDRHTFKKLYVQYVRPHVEFASPAWSPG